LRAQRGNPLTAWIATACGLAMTAEGEGIAMTKVGDGVSGL